MYHILRGGLAFVTVMAIGCAAPPSEPVQPSKPPDAANTHSYASCSGNALDVNGCQVAGQVGPMPTASSGPSYPSSSVGGSSAALAAARAAALAAANTAGGTTGTLPDEGDSAQDDIPSSDVTSTASGGAASGRSTAPTSGASASRTANTANTGGTRGSLVTTLMADAVDPEVPANQASDDETEPSTGDDTPLDDGVEPSTPQDVPTTTTLAAATAAGWRTHAEVSIDKTWHCAPTLDLLKIWSSQNCIILLSGIYQTAIIVRNRSATATPMSATTSDNVSGDRHTCARTAIPANDYWVCFGTAHAMPSVTSIVASGALVANGVESPVTAQTVTFKR
jgi:hypothetical protein